jgi:glyoxylase-like metal-dependent hydrolase (beta-lactamase superfamily II)
VQSRKEIQTKKQTHEEDAAMSIDRNKPVHEIKVLDLGLIKGVDCSFIVDKYSPGKPYTGSLYSYLIVGETIPPIIVDTGIKEAQLDIMSRVGMNVVQRPDQNLSYQLAKYGLDVEDIRVILHTHLHIDHAGNDDLFPNAKIIFPRKEMMFSVADLMSAQYPPEYITYLVWQLHVPGRIRLIDDNHELFPGIALELTEAHTWGGMNIKVNTRGGLAIICGDVISDERLQCVKNDMFPGIAKHAEHPAFPFGDQPSGNYWNLWAAKAGLQKVMAEADIVLPIHDSLVVEKYGYEI